MGLPDLIEIMPLAEGPLEVNVTMPGSKSITNRALILAVLAEGKVELTGALWSEDTQIMVDALRALGDPGKTRGLFIGFQQHLYTPQAVA